MRRVFIQKLEHQSGKLADWVRGVVVSEKQLCRHLCSGKQAGQNSWALTARQQTYEA
nr:Mobile element protein [Klebsiella pneumoniae]